MWNRFIRLVKRGRTAKRPYSEIELRVKPLVEKMNATGVIRTVASCQGHGILGKPPYVYFKAPQSIASFIEQLLRERTALGNPNNRLDWTVEGRFDENFELTFLLYSPTHYERSHSLVAMALFCVFRKRLDAEFLFLSDVIDQAVLLHIRKNDKPKIASSSNSDDKSDELA